VPRKTTKLGGDSSGDGIEQWALEQAIIASREGIPALSQVLTLLFHSSFTEY